MNALKLLELLDQHWPLDPESKKHHSITRDRATNRLRLNIWLSESIWQEVSVDDTDLVLPEHVLAQDIKDALTR